MTNDNHYRGNPQLKKSGKPINWTPELLQEWLKCFEDPIYFAEKYIKIVHVDHGFIPIELYDYQKEIITTMNNYRNTVVLTSRQAGKTTTAVVVILHYILFNEHKLVGLLANKGDAAREILNRIKLAYEALPEWLQQGIEEWNKGSISLENGCKVIAAATSSSNIRGKSCSLLYIDETAFIENWEEFFASVYPTISSGETTKMLFTSTPNGLNHFYKTCSGAKHPENSSDWNGFKLIEVPWNRVPGRDEEWKNKTLASMDFDLEKFEQEFNCEFAGSSGTLISSGVLKTLTHAKPLHTKDNLYVYEPPQKENQYLITADVSRGKGLDYSAFHVFDITSMPYKQVCTYRSNLITPLDYASILQHTGTIYNKAMILVEINDIGGQVADSLHFDYEYENIVYTENAGPSGKRISTGFSKTGNIDRGIRTTKTVKGVGCSVLKLLVEQHQLIIKNFETIYELSRFSKKGTSYQAEDGCNDDLVMGLVLFAWITSQQYFKELTDIETLQRLRDSTDKDIENQIFDFYVSTGHEDIIEPTVNLTSADAMLNNRDFQFF